MKRFTTLIATAGLLLASALMVAPGVALARCSSDQVELSVPIVSGQKCLSGNAGNGGVIVAYLIEIIKFASGLVGAIIVLMLIIAGIQYLTSAGDPGAVKAAKNRIINAITALVLFIFMYAILQAILPGGIFT